MTSENEKSLEERLGPEECMRIAGAWGVPILKAGDPVVFTPELLAKIKATQATCSHSPQNIEEVAKDESGQRRICWICAAEV